MKKSKQSIPFQNPQMAMFVSAGWQELGHSAGDNVITGKILRTQHAKRKILLVAGIHGDQTEGIAFMQYFCGEFACSQVSAFEQDIFLLPVLNPDGLFSFLRYNAKGVDINRNFPTPNWQPIKNEKYSNGEKAASEPETRIFLQVIEKFKPDLIISFHSGGAPMIYFSHKAELYAQAISQKNNMPIQKSVEKPLSGSLQDYAGLVKNIPTLVIEFERGLPLDSYYSKHRDAILQSFFL